MNISTEEEFILKPSVRLPLSRVECVPRLKLAASARQLQRTAADRRQYPPYARRALAEPRP